MHGIVVVFFEISKWNYFLITKITRSQTNYYVIYLFLFHVCLFRPLVNPYKARTIFRASVKDVLWIYYITRKETDRWWDAGEGKFENGSEWWGDRHRFNFGRIFDVVEKRKNAGGNRTVAEIIVQCLFLLEMLFLFQFLPVGI